MVLDHWPDSLLFLLTQWDLHQATTDPVWPSDIRVTFAFLHILTYTLEGSNYYGDREWELRFEPAVRVEPCHDSTKRGE